MKIRENKSPPLILLAMKFEYLKELCQKNPCTQNSEAKIYKEK